MFLSLLNDGGPLFMYTILIFLVLIIALFVQGLIKKGDNISKTISLIGSLGLFIVAWGFLGQIIGLIMAFDAIEAAGDISPAIMAAGLKISFLAPGFGLVTFLVSRLAIIILTWVKK